MANKELASTRINRLLVDGHGVKSAQVISDETGIPPEDVARRTRELFEAVDVLTIEDKRAKLVLQLESMVGQLSARMAGASDKSISGIANSARSAIGSVLKELADMESRSQVDVTAITQNMGRTLGELLNISLTHLREELKERYGTSDDEIMELVKEGVRIGQAELEQRISE